MLKKNDVVTSIDGYPVARDGTVLLRGWERVSYIYVYTQKYAGEKCAVEIIRYICALDIMMCGLWHDHLDLERASP